LKALLKTGLGPGAIELVDIPVPEPGYGQVRIKVTAAVFAAQTLLSIVPVCIINAFDHP
jgi:NADPH:quinone reductase-like Zn-dependent oxidoreductase